MKPVLRRSLLAPGIVLLGLLFSTPMHAESAVEVEKPVPTSLLHTEVDKAETGEEAVENEKGRHGVAIEDSTGSRENAATSRSLALLSRLTTFTADFSQTVLGASSELLQSSEGKIRVQRPARFRWEVKGPYPQLIVSNGELLYLYDPDLEQVQIEYTRESLSGTPALLLSGTTEQITHSFRVESAHDSDATLSADRMESFILYPRDQTSLYRRMVINFSGALPVSFQIIDNLDQRTEVVFSNIQSNIVLDPELFQFNILPGVDITGNAAERALSDS